MGASALTFSTNRHGQRVIAHAWPHDAPGCRAIQAELTQHIVTHDDFGPVATLGGIDIGFEDGGRTTRAAAVVLDAETLEIIERALVRVPTRMPYIPGLLSFREIPGALAALDQLAQRPDLVFVDGHGIAHPRRLGVATHLGLVTGLPTIGVAKKRLTGSHDEAPSGRGQWTPLRDKDDIIGAVLRSRVGVKPIFISSGHRVALDSGIAWTRRALTRYRLPETTRAADKLASNR
ncbi:deoxyribonuclease V [Salinisphaera aquimarina]|uniref:Endonuclease V n=1 Tax=Salinisphaera aquimarina TaxID=2094031 RepID=A0ABV7EIN7_9GAMM